ncbi:MAG TPA: bifunctional serine/threonine-protein kinase/formylglycine-generating enzyme family protein [bacterium]|nr:bifunctional serine/threonine-protein kinase/formylglycine-generating enzyme family protein [bacterium]
MTAGINIQPFVSSMSLLQTLTAGTGGFIDAQSFLIAGQGLFEALAPAHVPGMSEDIRNGVLTLFHQLVSESSDNGQLLKKPVQHALDRAGLLLRPEFLAREDYILQYLERFRNPEKQVAANVQAGGIYVHQDLQETILGLDQGDSFDAPLIIGALGPDGLFHIRRPVPKTLIAGSIPPEEDDFDTRVTQGRYGEPKPLTAQPIINVPPVETEKEAAPIEADVDELTPPPLGPPPERPEHPTWQRVWQAYRKNEVPAGDFLALFHRGAVPSDLMRDALQEGVIPYRDVVQAVVDGQLTTDDFIDLFSDCAFPLQTVMAGIHAGKIPLFTSSRAAIEEKLAELPPFSNRASLRAYLKRVEAGDLSLQNIRIAIQEGMIPYRDVIEEVASGNISVEGFLTTFAEGSFPMGPLLAGIRNGKIPTMVLVESLQDAFRHGTLDIEPFLEVMEEGDFPLANEANHRLLIRKPSYVLRTGHTVPMIFESEYELELATTKQEPEDKYHLLGAGGTSRVYLGVQKGTEREVAIKVVTIANLKRQKDLQKGFDNEIVEAPFSKSPLFVQVYATGLTSKANPFIVMERLSGALSQYVDDVNMGRELFDLPKSMGIARQMVAAAAEMHRHGYIHRDIKTENYFLDENGNAKLGDQGLRRKLSETPREPEEGLWGTPGAMPPEKLNGLVPDNKKTDVFALGVALYELFTGDFCFGAPNLPAIMHKVTSHDPEPPSVFNAKSKRQRQIPAFLDEIIMKCLEKDADKRYADAIDVLYDLVTAHAAELEREGEESRAERMSRYTGADEKIHEDIWQEKLQSAIRELQSVYNQFPDPRIRRKMVELNYKLHVWADRVGNEREIQRTLENIRKLEPQSEEARNTRQFIQANFQIDGSRPQGSNIAVQIRHLEHRAGYFELDRKLEKKKDLPRKPLHLDRGGVWAAQFSIEGMVSFIRDIPVRPGDYSLRIPFYYRNEIPDGWILIPAGPTAARTSMGSFAEHFENWREVDHDYAMGPLVTNEDYFSYIKALAADDRSLVEGRMPRDWGFDFFDPAVHRHGTFVTKDGQPIEWKAPVAHITPEDAQGYLRFLEQSLRRQGIHFQRDFDPNLLQVRFPTLYEWRRAFRPDPREWAHGDGQPQVGDMAVRIRDPRGAGPIKPMRIDVSTIRDVSHFSVLDGLAQGEPERVVRHIVGNLRKFLHIGGEDDHARITHALGLNNGQLGREFIAVAGADCSMSPADADILAAHPVNGTGLIGILPVIQLRSAYSTPSLESLKRRYFR